MRTYDEINAEIETAIDTHNHAALFTLADELSTLSTPQAISAAVHARARAYRLSGSYTEALEQFHRVLALYDETGNRIGLASANLGMGIVHYLQGNYSETLVHYNRALELNKELGLRLSEAAALGNIGTLYQSLGSYPESLEYLLKALAIHDELGHQSGMAMDNCNIGNIYHEMGVSSEALNYYRRGLEIFEEINDRQGIAKVEHNLGLIHADAGEFSQAVVHIQRALAINTEMENRAGIAHVTGNYINVLIRMGDVETASKLQADNTELLHTVPGVRAGHFINAAKLLEHQQNLQGASEALHEALNIVQSAGIRGREAAIRKHLRDLALKQNDLAGYVEHNNEYTRITEEINGKDTATKLAMQAKQREIDAVQREHAQHMAVLHSTLPKHIADRVARGETVNDHYDNAAVLFLDIVGFTTISDSIPSGHVVHLLEQIFTTLDAVCKRNNVIKIKTIGDSYMAVSFDDVQNAATCALDMIASLDVLVITMPPALGDTSWTKDVGDIKVRIGIHCGAITAGVIGTDRMQYDVWGDTVNVASRMESTSESGKIHVSEALANALNEHKNSPPDPLSHASLERGSYTVVPRGTVDVKGKGLMQTYWLLMK
ncbi:MAG: tetratricopeptide repeat protein [Ignavibacteria bacterium]|nr:tetratricopeptide repeat protein [Ignavibacteria bacterium]